MAETRSLSARNISARLRKKLDNATNRTSLPLPTGDRLAGINEAFVGRSSNSRLAASEVQDKAPPSSASEKQDEQLVQPRQQ